MSPEQTVAAIAEVWPIASEIEAVSVVDRDDSEEYYRVGRNGVTRIEKVAKNGEFCHLPYVRIWVGDQPFAEFGQHKVIGVYYLPARPKEGGAA